MSKQKNKTLSQVAMVVFAILLAVIVLRVLHKPKAGPPTQIEQTHDHSVAPVIDEPAPEQADDPVAERTNENNQPIISLIDIIKNAKGWGPVYQQWYAKAAPDFTLTDITSKQHKLSDYRGKNVMIIFWATWCGPCIMEIPHLIELRKTIPEDKLAMLAISNENLTTLNRFAATNKKINYTVFSTATQQIPTPFDRIRAIPTSFFINPDGKIKLATEGVLSLPEIKRILQAE